MKKKITGIALQVMLVFAVGVLLILMAGGNPPIALRHFFNGIFGSLNGFAEVLVKATPLIFLGLGISVAFSTGFFNIGAEGQLYIGALVSAFVVLLLPGLPGLVKIVLSLVLAFISGGAWALVPAVLKRKMGISETVSTIMFNYIAIMMVGIVIRGPLRDPADFLPQTARVPSDSVLPPLMLPTRLHLGFIIALLCAVLVWFIMKRTTLGYELRVCGMNERAAFCTGLPVGRSLLLAAVISGGLAGIAGINEMLGVQKRLLEDLSGGVGYNAILVSLLADNHPLKVIGVSLGFAALQVGANTMQRQMGIPAAIVSILTGFIVLMILSKDFKEIHRENKREKTVVR